MKRFPAVFWCEVDDDFLKKVAQCAKTDLEKTQIQPHVDSLLALRRYGGESRMDCETRKLLKELVQRRRDQVVSTDTSAKHKGWDQYYRLHCMEKMSRQIEGIMSRAQLIQGLFDRQFVRTLDCGSQRDGPLDGQHAVQNRERFRWAIVAQVSNQFADLHD